MTSRGIPLSAPAEPPRVAVVDDDPHVIRALVRLVTRIVPGVQCETAHDGFSAGALLTSFRPHLVFLDVVMPGMSGVEVCKHLRATPGLAGTRVIIVSGHLSADLRAQLAALDVDRVVSKPFKKAEIEAAIASLGTAWTSGHGFQPAGRSEAPGPRGSP